MKVRQVEEPDSRAPTIFEIEVECCILKISFNDAEELCEQLTELLQWRFDGDW